MHPVLSPIFEERDPTVKAESAVPGYDTQATHKDERVIGVVDGARTERSALDDETEAQYQPGHDAEWVWVWNGCVSHPESCERSSLKREAESKGGGGIGLKGSGPA